MSRINLCSKCKQQCQIDRVMTCDKCRQQIPNGTVFYQYKIFMKNKPNTMVSTNDDYPDEVYDLCQNCHAENRFQGEVKP